MKTVIAKMRTDFDMVAKQKLQDGSWDQQTVSEAGQMIKQLIEAEDHTGMMLWARWLADISAAIVFHDLVVKHAEAAIRLEIAGKRAKA